MKKRIKFERKNTSRTLMHNQLPLTHTSRAVDPCPLSKPLENQSSEDDSLADYPIRTHSSRVRAKKAAHASFRGPAH